MGFRLTASTFAADVRGDLVFLDAKRNRYLCLPRSTAAPLMQGPQAGPPDQSLIEELSGADLLIRDSSDASVTDRMPARTALGDLSSVLGKRGLVIRDIIFFGIAVARTAARMALQGPARWLCSPGSRLKKPGALDEAFRLAQIFHRLRPWVPKSGRCLPSSILLIEFLRLRGVEADCVFGVRTYPFEAHCWVEKDGVVLNDTLEHVRWFTPIAVA